jgi:hypothetical protein
MWLEMRSARSGLLLACGAGVIAFALSLDAAAQFRDLSQGRPAPRTADGRISFSGTPGEVGNWEGSTANGAELIYPTPEDDPRNGTDALPTNLSVERVPFQPWARALFDYRQRTYLKDEPHVRCKASGVARLFHTPYGLEILHLADSGEMIFVGVGSPHSWRVVDLRATEHAAERDPSRYGHSIGQWEGDTLVIDTIGFADSFWMNRLGLPHTDRLHTIERISRPNFDTLVYEVTIDDPGAYTATWSGGFYLNWRKGNEPFDYLCQDNNLDPERLVGPDG